MLCGGVLLAGCANDGSSQGPRSGNAQPKVAGSTAASLANCGEWKRATPKQRRATVEELRGQLTEQTSKSERSILSDERAYEIFEHACRQRYADDLRLYKLYVKAAAFEPLRP
jgi:hypothetical protein